jgi:hypothetical protein
LLQEVEKSTFQSLYRQYASLSKSLYHTLVCLDASIQLLDKYIANGRETNLLSSLVIDNLTKDKDELVNVVQSYQNLISKEPQPVAIEELQRLLTDFNDKKSKALLIFDRLRGGIIPADVKGCSEGLF